MYRNVMIDDHLHVDMPLEDKCRHMEQTAVIYKMCAVAILQPELRQRIKDELKEREIHIDFDRAMQNVHGEHRRMLYDVVNERIEAAHPSTRDFSLEELPDDAQIDMVSHFDNWISRNKYNVDKELG